MNTPAGRFARTLPLSARGLGFVLPALQGFFIGLALGEALSDVLFPAIQDQNLAFGDPVPPNYTADPVGPDPWTGVPNNTLGTPMARANTGYNFILIGPPFFVGDDMPYLNPVQYAQWEQRHFFGAPTGEWWATSSQTRTGDLIIPLPLGGFPVSLPNLQHVIPEWAPAFPQSAPGADIADNMRNSPFEQGYKIGSYSAPEARDVWAVNFSPTPSFRQLPEDEVIDIFKWLGGGGKGPPPKSRPVPGPTWDFDPKRREIEGIPNYPMRTSPDGFWDFMDRPWPRDWVFHNPWKGWRQFFGKWYYWDGKQLWEHDWPYGIPPEIFFGPGIRRGVAETLGEDFLYDYETTPNVRFDTGAKPGEGGAITTPPYRNQGYRIPDAKIKTNMDPRWVATRLYNAFTEFGDFTDAVYKALPQKVKLPVWDARLKKWRPPTGVEKWERLTEHWAELNWSKVLVNVYEDQIEDFYYGQIGKRAGKAQQSVFDKFGMGDGPTYLTRTMKLGVGRLPNFSLPQMSGNIRPSRTFLDGLY